MRSGNGWESHGTGPTEASGDLPLGEMLVARGRLAPQQLLQALERQRGGGSRLGEVLGELGLIDRPVIVEALAEQLGVPRADVQATPAQPEAVRLIPPELATKHLALPLSIAGDRLVVAMADPFDDGAVRTLRVVAGRRIEVRLAPEADLREGLRKAYGSHVARMIANFDAPPAESAGSASVDGEDAQSVLQLQELAREPSVVNLVNLILLEAVEARASDVHIEPFEKVLRVKYRIDGMLQEVPPPPRHLYAAIVSRIKIMGGMNIAERFVPQDGHIAFRAPRGTVDIRVGTVPTVFGESVALRLLDRTVGLRDLQSVGMPAQQLRHFGHVLEKPHGIILVTGPTGSGKTTTLYAALNKIYSPHKKIITIEDPVEYQLDGVNQIPVNRKRGVDFAAGLRAILRQDPDVIMVGEIRDRETADIAIRAAMTGHLVFSTLHTNDAAGAVTRLIDMGVEPFLLASSLEGVLAQRLVRRVCEHCKVRDEPSPEALARLGMRNGAAAGFVGYRGTGCRHCRESGYAGRTGLFELLRVTDPMRRVIGTRATAAEIAAQAGPEHQSMRQHGVERVRAGETTVEEVLRVTQDTPTEEAMGTE